MNVAFYATCPILHCIVKSLHVYFFHATSLHTKTFNSLFLFQKNLAKSFTAYCIRSHCAYQDPSVFSRDSNYGEVLARYCQAHRFFVSRRGAENAEALWRCKPPPFPHETCGIGSLGMGCGTPLPVAVQATMWNRRMRNLPTATRGTDARPMTISARKSSLAHISCVGLRHPSERRDSTPVSKTCHST